MKNLYLTTALALISSPALADITPEELWQSWQETTAEFGASLTSGQQEWQGNVLVIHEAKTSMDFGFFTMEQTIETIELGAQDDGSVTVKFDSALSGFGHITLPDTPTPMTTLSGHLSGTSGVVSGTVDNYTYEFIIGEMLINGDTKMGEDAAVQSNALAQTRTLNLQGTAQFVKTSAGTNIEYTFSAEAVESTQDATTQTAASTTPFKQSQRTTAAGYTGEINFFLPSPDPEANQGRFWPRGALLDADITIQTFDIFQKTASPFLNMELDMAQGPVSVSVNINLQSASISGEGEGLRMMVNNPSLGAQPYSVEIAKTGGAIAVPLYPSDTPQEARYAISLEGVSLSDSIWAFADPQNTLSRAPANFAFAADFSTTLLLDWTNIEAVKAWEGAPALLHKITLERFLVALENAQLEGEGAVEFSNDGPAPMPNGGALSFSLTGIPALLEKLGGLPMVDPSIIAQANGMLGAFTAEGANGARVSEIEFGAEGQVFVNGLQVQ